MIDKVEVGKKYRLIDKEGYVSCPINGNINSRLLADKDVFDENMCVIITSVNKGYGSVHGNPVISPIEYHLFELVNEGSMDTEEPKVITPETEVTITTTYGELAKAYYVMGRANGKTHGKLLWEKVSDLLGDENRSIYWGNEPKHPTINYHLVQEDWESLFFKSKEQQEKEFAIKEKRDMIAKLEKEIEQLGGE